MTQLRTNDIQRVVASHFGLDASIMRSACRKRRFARPRQIAMYLTRDLTGASFPEIGRRFGGRDHTTAIHACRLIQSLMADPDFAAEIAELRQSLGALACRPFEIAAAEIVGRFIRRVHMPVVTPVPVARHLPAQKIATPRTPPPFVRISGECKRAHNEAVR